LVERLSRFDGPPEQFLVNLLSVQCHMTAARGGAVLRAGDGQQVGPLAVYPPPERGATSPLWLAQAVESAQAVLSEGTTVVHPLHSAEDLYGAKARRHLVMIPISTEDRVIRGYEAFLLETADPQVIAVATERLELTVGLLSLYEVRLTLQAKQFDLDRMSEAMQTLSSVNDTERFKAGAMAICNELASRWKCNRVSVGFLKRRSIQLGAMSHTEKLNRKMKLVRDIEAAMEECFDQDVEVMHPAPPDAMYVSRFSAELAREHGPSSVVHLPLRHKGECVGVLTLERPADAPLERPQVEALRLVCDLATPRLESLRTHDKWFGAKLADAARTAAATLVGPKHTWAKLLGAAMIAFTLFVFLGKGDYNADAPFMLETSRRFVVSAPFDGYIHEVMVEPDDPVHAGVTVLGTLDDSDLHRERLGAIAEQSEHQRDLDAALAAGKTVEAQIAKARINRLEQRINLLNARIERATLIAPVDGRILSGDLKQRINAPVRTGDKLFEVGPIDSLYAELAVPEDLVSELRVGHRGELATTSNPDRKLGFTVDRIHPVAEVVDQRNVFKVKVTLDESDQTLRPGMAGIAKVRIDRRSYAWLWTHRLVNWLKMKLWW